MESCKVIVNRLHLLFNADIAYLSNAKFIQHYAEHFTLLQIYNCLWFLFVAYKK